MICAPSEDSDQPGHPPSLIRVFAVRMKKAWVLSYPLSASEDSDRTGRMTRLICVFAERTSFCWIFLWAGSNVLIKVFKGTSVQKLELHGIKRLIVSTYKRYYLPFSFMFQSEALINWTASSEFGTYRLCEQRRFRRACASAQSRQNLRCSLIHAVSQEEPSDRKPDPCPLWMAGHAQLKYVITECSKTQIRLTGLGLYFIKIFRQVWCFQAS